MSSQSFDDTYNVPRRGSPGLWVLTVLTTLCVMFQAGIIIIWPLVEQRYPLPEGTMQYGGAEESGGDPASTLACLGVPSVIFYVVSILVLPGAGVYYVCTGQRDYAIISLYCIIISIVGLWLSWNLVGKIFDRMYFG